MRPYTQHIADLLAEHGPLTALELRRLNGVNPSDRRRVNLHAWGLVEARKVFGVDKLADGRRYALPGVPHETAAEREHRLASAVPLPSAVTPVDTTDSEIRGIAVAGIEALHNITGREYIEDWVEEVIERFDRAIIVLKDHVVHSAFMIYAGPGVNAVHLLTADQVELVRKAAERKPDYYEAHEAEAARQRYETLFDRQTEVILRWFSKSAHKGWCTKKHYALLARRKLFTHFFELIYTFAGQTYRDGRLCVSHQQATNALARARKRVKDSFQGAEIVRGQVAPFVKQRVRVRAERSGL